jgi:hypothetical protein
MLSLELVAHTHSNSSFLSTSSTATNLQFWHVFDFLFWQMIGSGNFAHVTFFMSAIGVPEKKWGPTPSEYGL